MMGLDVRLMHWLADEAEVVRVEGEIERRREAKWDEILTEYNVSTYEDLSPTQRDDFWAIYNEWIKDADMELDKYGWLPGSREYVKRASMLSSKHADHVFKVGYWCSSYNVGGLGAVLRRTIGEELENLVQPWLDEETYMVEPDWLALAERVEQCLASFKQWVADKGDVDIMAVLPPHEGQDVPSNEQEALSVYRQQKASHTEWRDGYRNGLGEFEFGDQPLPVRALIRGTVWRAGQRRLCTWVVYERADGWQEYVMALEIMVETCKWVASQPDPEKYVLCWSA